MSSFTKDSCWQKGYYVYLWPSTCISELHLIIAHCLKQGSICRFFSFINISFIYKEDGDVGGRLYVSTRKALSWFQCSASKPKGENKAFQKQTQQVFSVPPYRKFRSICGGVLIKSHRGCLEEVVSFPGKGQQGNMPMSSGVYAYGLHFYLKKKTPIESYPFSGLPLSFLAGYISHVRHKFTSVLHKPLSYLVMVTVSYWHQQSLVRKLR